jgi:hypothetical protein
MDDLGSVSATCEMCETQQIRYVHSMQHTDFPEILAVGCVCAERMEDDYLGPKRRERIIRSSAGRKRKWLTRSWKVSTRGNIFINTDGMNITIYKKQNKRWAGRIEERASGRSVNSRFDYPTVEAAKLAAFDAMIFLKTKRGWG